MRVYGTCCDRIVFTAGIVLTSCFDCVRAFTPVEAAWRSLELYIPVNSTRWFAAFGMRNTPSSHSSSGLRSNRCPLSSCSSPGNCSFSVVLCNLGVDTSDRSNGTSNRHARASISNNAITERKNGTNQKRQRLLAEYARNTGTERELFSDRYCICYPWLKTCWNRGQSSSSMAMTHKEGDHS